MTSSTTTDYGGQARGSLDAYRRYLDGMDASMKQKIALAAAHLLCSGKVADMGMGSGTGSDALAALYPQLEVVGVDVNESMVSLAKERYRRHNLTFTEGDIATQVFPPESLNAIVNSSVFHHVTSFNGYRPEEVMRALSAQYRQLKQNGIVLVRDFVAPEERDVWLDLPTDDGDETTDPTRCNSANLFRLFSAQFRTLSNTPGFELRPVADTDGQPIPKGFDRFQCAYRTAAEFLLRKDYRTDWETEIKEEYTYYTKQQFESAFGALGLRVLASVALYNSWIVRHRFEGKAHLRTLQGEPLPFPPTNYIISGEKVDHTEGVRFEHRGPCPTVDFLEMQQYGHNETGQIRDLVRRPNRTIDIIPWFEAGGDIYVLIRKSYPRPLLQACPESNPLIGGSSAVGYVSEPLNVIQTDHPIGNSVERALTERANLAPEQLLRFEDGTTYYPSPGGILEEIRSVFVEVSPVYTTRPLEGLSGFSTSGVVQAMEARQLLRAAEVGGLPDARLELNVYHLLQSKGLDPGPWIGDEIHITGSSPPSIIGNIIAPVPGRRAFTQLSPSANTAFLHLGSARFAELNAQGETLSEKELAYVVPRYLSTNTVSTAIIRRSDSVYYIGVVDDDLPAAQGFEGNSNLYTTPAWRLPRGVFNRTSAIGWLTHRLTTEHGLEVGQVFTLGGNYYPSAGVTPENVLPVCIEVLAETPSDAPIIWVPLHHLIEEAGRIRDGHLRIVANRVAHALGIMQR